MNERIATKGVDRWPTVKGMVKRMLLVVALAAFTIYLTSVNFYLFHTPPSPSLFFSFFSSGHDAVEKVYLWLHPQQRYLATALNHEEEPVSRQSA